MPAVFDLRSYKVGSSAESVVRIMSAEEIVAGGGNIPDKFVWPQAKTIFLERTMRFKQLARQNVAASEYMELMAAVTQAQHDCLASFPAVPLPDSSQLEQAKKHGLQPLSAIGWQRDPAWQTSLQQLLNAIKKGAPSQVKSVINSLLEATPEEVNAQADLILAGTSAGLNVAFAPFIGAALQVYWVYMVCNTEGLQSDALYSSMNLNEANVCPCCGSAPVASYTHSGGKTAGQRYVVCSLCNTQWNMVRIKCTRCLNEDGVSYMSLTNTETPDERAAKAAVQAESCNKCNSYLKIMHFERNPSVDPVADDIASLQLDILMSEDNKVRHGANLLLFFANESDGTN